MPGARQWLLFAGSASVFGLSATLADLVVAPAAGAVGARLASRPPPRRRQRWVSGRTLIGLGGFPAASGSCRASARAAQRW